MPQSYFRDIHSVITQAIENSRFSVCIAVSWFNDKDIFETVLDATKRGVLVKMVLTNDFINIAGSLDWNVFEKLGGEMYLYGSRNSTMHHKFCLIDKEILLLGSYNWTYRARNSNRENLLVFTKEDNFDIFSYQLEFQELVSNSILHTKLTDRQTVRRKIVYYKVRDFMLENGFNSVINRIQKSHLGGTFVVFINANNNCTPVFLSPSASKGLTEGQIMSKDFFKGLVVLSEEFEIDMEPISTILLKQEQNSNPP